MRLSKETIKKLKAVKAAILAEPELYDQTDYPTMRNSCTFPCCIEGWAMWVKYQDVQAYESALATRPNGFSAAEVSDFLGITTIQWDLLFSQWDGRFRAAWINPGTFVAARAGAKRIDLFISSGGTK